MEEKLSMKLYVGAYASIWMTMSPIGTTPQFDIVDNESGEILIIEGTNWKDLRDVLDSLKIYEYEKMEEDI